MKFINKYRKKLKTLINAQDHHSFWVNNGPILKNLIDLKNAFERMTHQQYIYHANDKKNDFARWVDEVLRDKKCAIEIAFAKTTHAAKKVVEKYLKEYQ